MCNNNYNISLIYQWFVKILLQYTHAINFLNLIELESKYLFLNNITKPLVYFLNNHDTIPESWMYGLVSIDIKNNFIIIIIIFNEI